jgi:hypothetical protein
MAKQKRNKGALVKESLEGFGAGTLFPAVLLPGF